MPIDPDGATGEPGILHRLTHLHPHGGRWPHRELRSVLWYHLGLACVNFLSSHFEVMTYREGTLFSRQFRQGIEQPKRPSHLTGVERGSYVSWRADVEIFKSSRYDPREITDWLQLQTFLYPGVRIEWRDEGSGHRQLFHEPGGIGTLLTQRTTALELFHSPVRLKLQRDGDMLDFACAYTSSEGEILTYANGEGFEDPRWFLASFQRGASRVLRTWAIRQGLLPPTQRLSPNGLLHGLHIIFAFQLRNPEVAGNQCQQLAAPVAQSLAYAAGRRMMTQLVQAHPDAAARVIQRACRTARAEAS